MAEIFLGFLGEILFNGAIYVPGLLISVVSGRSPKDLGEGELIALSLAFWGVVIMLGLFCWAVFSWLT